MDHRSSITPRDLEHMLCDETVEPKALPLSLLEQITNGFSDEQKIGNGGFAVVYKGMLENKTVAVKRMSNALMDEKMFHREVQCLVTAKHNNIIRFLGYCADRQGIMGTFEGNFVMADIHERLLCFEYLPKGSLLEYITDTSRNLQWRDWYQIITGICHGLHYLHREKIVHLDLNPANILLSDNLVAKIADFGPSRCFIGETESQVISKIGGTRGYLAPECFNHHAQVNYWHSYRLDLYSLGVVVMEILTKGKEYHSVDNVVEIWSDMVEKSQRDEQLEQVRVCAEIGIQCTNFNPAKRPDTQRIINKLDGIETKDEYIETCLVTSQQAENAPNEQHQGMPNSAGEASSKDVESWSKSPEKSQRELQHEQLRVDMDAFIETGVSTSQQLGLKDLVFTVKNEQGCELKQLRELNNLHGSLVIDRLQNVRSRAEALEANLAAKELLTELKLKWDPSSTRCSPEVEADVLDGLCPPVGLKNLEISCYAGSRYPDWMVGRQNGGPKDLHDLVLTCAMGPFPLVEAFPHLRALRLWGGTWDALPSNMEHLTSLKSLSIGLNDNIRLLPTLPRSLEEFSLSHCDHEFMKSCVTARHPNWRKIKHIPKKTFNGIPTPVMVPSSIGRLGINILDGMDSVKSFWDRMTT